MRALRQLGTTRQATSKLSSSCSHRHPFMAAVTALVLVSLSCRPASSSSSQAVTFDDVNCDQGRFDISDGQLVLQKFDSIQTVGAIPPDSFPGLVFSEGTCLSNVAAGSAIFVAHGPENDSPIQRTVFVNTATLASTMVLHDFGIENIVFSEDGRFAIATSSDYTRTVIADGKSFREIAKSRPVQVFNSFAEKRGWGPFGMIGGLSGFSSFVDRNEYLVTWGFEPLTLRLYRIHLPNHAGGKGAPGESARSSVEDSVLITLGSLGIDELGGGGKKHAGKSFKFQMLDARNGTIVLLKSGPEEGLDSLLAISVDRLSLIKSVPAPCAGKYFLSPDGQKLFVDCKASYVTYTDYERSQDAGPTSLGIGTLVDVGSGTIVAKYRLPHAGNFFGGSNHIGWDAANNPVICTSKGMVSLEKLD